ncbi:unnamed protein product, partial [Porites lobata]
MGETKGKKIGTLRCRGLKPPVIRGYAAAFGYWFRTFGHTEQYSEAIITAEDGSQQVIPKGNPMSSPAVTQTMKQLVKRAKRPTARDTRHGRVPYEPKKAPPFTIQQMLRMRAYCLNTIEGLRGLWLWTITLFSFALFLRGEEPLRLKVKNLRLPANFNSGEPITIPKRIEVKIPWSKADRKAKGVTLTLWSNPLCKELCPVRAIIAWLLVADIRSGYLFPRICKNNLTSLRNSARGVTTYRKTFVEMSKALFEKEFTTHSIRRSAARWAARCGADDSTIKRAGRWKSSALNCTLRMPEPKLLKNNTMEMCCLIINCGCLNLY